MNIPLLKRFNTHLEKTVHVALRCPCGASLKAPVKYVGRELKCPKCATMLVVPEPPMAAASQPAEMEVLEPLDMPEPYAATPAQAPLPAAAPAPPPARVAKAPKSKKKNSLLPYLIGVGVLLIAGAGVYLMYEYRSNIPDKDEVVIKGADGKALTNAELDSMKHVPRGAQNPPEKNDYDSGERKLASNSENVPDDDLSLQELIKVVEPSIVRIFVVEFNGDEKVGSGFFVDKEGKIFTNNHVIRGAAKVTVETADGKKADALGFLVANKEKDLAIIQVNPDDFDCVPIAIAEKLPIKGDDVAAFGAPQGFSFSNSQGVVGSVRPGREVAEILDEMAPGMYERHGFTQNIKWIQHSAAISGGNSGGPLVNFRGELVGVNTWTHPGGQNLNFASTMDQVRKVFTERLDKKGMLMKFATMSPSVSGGGR